ncbi:hypothetical protein D3C78_1008540 [compost metagenome]
MRLSPEPDQRDDGGDIGLNDEAPDTEADDCENNRHAATDDVRYEGSDRQRLESQRAAIIHLLKHRCRVQRQQYADRHDDRRQPFDLKPALQFRREHADGNGQQCRHRNRGIKRQIDVAGLQIAFLHDRIRESEFRQHLDQHQHQPGGGDHAVIGRAEETGEDNEENGGKKLAAPVLDDGPEHAFQGRIAY